MNAAISAAITRANSYHIVFVDYDQYYQSTVGRFCEAGQGETAGNREGLLLYEYYTDDNVAPGVQTAANTPLTRTGNPVMNGTFEGTIKAMVLAALAANSSLTPAIPQDDTAATVSATDVQATSDQLVTGSSSSVLPDSYGRIFHPRPAGHFTIANLVLYHMSVRRAQLSGQPTAPEAADLNVCPIGVNSVTTTPATPGPTSVSQITDSQPVTGSATSSAATTSTAAPPPPVYTPE